MKKGTERKKKLEVRKKKWFERKWTKYLIPFRLVLCLLVSQKGKIKREKKAIRKKMKEHDKEISRKYGSISMIHTSHASAYISNIDRYYYVLNGAISQSLTLAVRYFHKINQPVCLLCGFLFLFLDFDRLCNWNSRCWLIGAPQDH